MFRKAEKIRKIDYWGIVFAILIFLLIIGGCIYFVYFELFEEKHSEIIRIHAAALIVLTLIFIYVAWFQLKNLNIISKADFLLRMDDRFSSHEIIKAREIIHVFYCKTRTENICIKYHIEKISKEIKKIGAVEEKAEDFIYLLNFLDFLETISYFCKRGYISIKDIDELLAGSIIYYYKIYKPWIDYRRRKYENENYYCELESLVKEIEKSSCC